MSEMTVTEHNEKLILEKEQLKRAMIRQQNHLAMIIGGMMRQMKRKTVNLKAENICLPGVSIHTNDDGSVTIKFLTQAEPDEQA